MMKVGHCCPGLCLVLFVLVLPLVSLAGESKVVENQISKDAPVAVGTFGEPVSPTWSEMILKTRLMGADVLTGPLDPKKDAGTHITWSAVYARAPFTMWFLSENAAHYDFAGAEKSYEDIKHRMRSYAAVSSPDIVGERIHAVIGGGMVSPGKGGAGGIAQVPPEKVPNWFSLAIDMDMDMDSNRANGIAPVDANNSEEARIEDKMEDSPDNPLGALVLRGGRSPLILRKLMELSENGGKSLSSLVEGYITIKVLDGSDGGMTIYEHDAGTEALEDWKEPGAPGPARIRLKQQIFQKLLDGHDVLLDVEGRNLGAIRLAAYLYVRAKGTTKYTEYSDIVRMTVVETNMDVELPYYYIPIEPNATYPPGYSSGVNTNNAVMAAAAAPAGGGAPPTDPPPAPTPRPCPVRFRLAPAPGGSNVNDLTKVIIIISVNVTGFTPEPVRIEIDVDNKSSYPPQTSRRFYVNEEGNILHKTEATHEVVWDGYFTVGGKLVVADHLQQVKVQVECVNKTDKALLRGNQATTTWVNPELVVTGRITAQVGKRTKLTATHPDIQGTLRLMDENSWYPPKFVVYKMENGKPDPKSAGVFMGTLVKNTMPAQFTYDWAPKESGEYAIAAAARVENTVAVAEHVESAVIQTEAISKDFLIVKVSGEKRKLKMYIVKKNGAYGIPGLDVTSWVEAGDVVDNMHYFPECCLLKIDVLRQDNTIDTDFSGQVEIWEPVTSNWIFSGKHGDTNLTAWMPLEINGGTITKQIQATVPFMRSNEHPILKIRFTGDSEDQAVKMDAQPEIKFWCDNIKLGNGTQPQQRIVNGSNGMPDWIDVQINYINDNRGNDDVKTVLAHVTGYDKNILPQDGMVGVMSVSLIRQEFATMHIKTDEPRLRPKNNAAPSFERRTFNTSLDYFVLCYLHESRHGYQNYLCSKGTPPCKTGDPDDDYLPTETETTHLPSFKIVDKDGKEYDMTLKDNEAGVHLRKHAPYDDKEYKAFDRTANASMVCTNKWVSTNPPLRVTCTYALNAQDAKKTPLSAVQCEMQLKTGAWVAVPTYSPAQGSAGYGSWLGFDPVANQIVVLYDNNQQVADKLMLDVEGKPLVRISFDSDSGYDPQTVRELDAYLWSQDWEGTVQ